jgi:hypothetical protein
VDEGVPQDYVLAHMGHNLASWAYSGETLGGTFNFLESRNYRVFLIKEDGLFDCSYETVRDYFRYSNYVAVRASALTTVEKFTKGPII